MGLFNRKKKQDDDSNGSGEVKKEKGAWRRPANTAFKQQRLKAWQPILTPKTVLPTLFIIGIIFAPIGGILVWGSSLVSEMTFDYSDCEKLNPSSLAEPGFVDMPSNKFSYRLRSADEKAKPLPPKYAFIDNTGNASVGLSDKRQCIVEFDIPAELNGPVLFYYKLTNFFQNHRRYVKSLNTDQLKGKAVSASDLQDSDCKPLAQMTVNGTNLPIYPCGLIANSFFNDTFDNPRLLNPPSGTFDVYNFSSVGIAWPGEAKKYVSKPGYSNLSAIVPPPNWRDRFPNGYTEENIPDLRNNEHFQNWMRTAGLPTFTKLYGRNDTTPMPKGIYRIIIGLNYPVLPYKGTKSFVISTVSWIGGKNPFLGWAYVAAASVFVLLAILGTARHLIKPRRLGDMSLLSWNRP
ncbi:cell cycle control protein [Collybia nuda]|uniref:Cell cycle control protein n=1 Tax=Collybia nuda TaxID=64659 RepID=A0A9P6CBD0_9AGAR|nr:cell cycle control protein [Collybia nuda]